MKQIISRLLIVLMVCTGAIALPCHCMAQSTGGDTSANNRTVENGFVAPTPKDSTATINKKSPVVIADTVFLQSGPWQPNPKKAGLYSALLPGLGQLYNRQYWKIPVVFAGLGTAGYIFVKNQTDYQSYRKAYLGRINNPTYIDKYTGVYSITQLQQLQNDYSKFVNLTVLFGTLGYALQVLDAITSAHLKNFDISRDLSMRMRPVVTPMGGLGMGLVMNFK